PDLGRKRFVRGHDFVRRNSYPYDRNGHGTFVAGLISQATNNGIGVTGLAYETQIMPVRVLDYEGKGDVATTEHGCLADYSNTGSGLDLVAPGGGADAAIDGDPNCRPLEDPGRDVYQYTFRGTNPRRFGLP